MKTSAWIFGQIYILCLSACGDGGYKCGGEEQYCGGAEEICVCQTRSCAIPTELSDDPSQKCAFVYREFPFAAESLAEQCVDIKDLNSEADQTKHIPAGSRLTCAEIDMETGTADTSTGTIDNTMGTTETTASTETN